MTGARYRGSIAVWALLLAYASLYPFWPLRVPAPDAIAGFFLPPRYPSRSDVVFNVIAYVPLGMLACLFYRQLARGWQPIARAVGFAAVFSLSMELVQFFIPNRVASLYDLLANAGGALLGSLVFLDPLYSIVTRPLGELREGTLIPGAWGDAGLVLVMLWLLAQLNPALPFFGAGDIAGEAETSLQLIEWTAVGMGICGFGLFISTVVRHDEGSLRVTVVLLSTALWLKFMFASFMLQPHFSAEWVTTGRVIGLIAGMAIFIPLRKLGRFWRMYLALVLILAGALLAKIFGAYSPVEEFLRLFRWPHGQLGSFATLTRFIHELWPFGAVVFLMALFIHGKRGHGMG
jgi:VanZ family protein